MTAIVDGKTRSVAFVCAAYLIAGALAAMARLLLPTADPLIVAAVADLLGTVCIFGFSMMAKNSSVYDPYWSVAPVVIAAYWWGAGEAALNQPRPWVILFLVSLWGARLTFNWLRRWQGLEHEDWRYVDIRRKTGRFYWPASFLGIHLMPTLLVFLGCVPLYPALRGGGRPWGLLDVLAASITLIAIVIETAADTQLHRYQLQASSSSQSLNQGLWAYCRHPNYFGEVLFWWGLFLFGLAAAPGWWWSAVGPIAITLLFILISIPLIDRRMIRRRPQYQQRMREVPALVPWFPL